MQPARNLAAIPSPCGPTKGLARGIGADAAATLIAAAAALLPHARVAGLGWVRTVNYTTVAAAQTNSGAGVSPPLELAEADPDDLQFVTVLAKLKAAPGIASRLYVAGDSALLATSDDGTGDPWVVGAVAEVASGESFSTLLVKGRKLHGIVVGPVAGTTGSLLVHRVMLRQILDSMEGLRRDLSGG